MSSPYSRRQIVDTSPEPGPARGSPFRIGRTVVPLTIAALLIAVPRALPAQDDVHRGHEHTHEKEQEQEHSHGQEHQDTGESAHHHRGLHFTHPLITESPSPDTKLRLDYRFMDLLEEGHEENAGIGTAEVAFHRTFSIEVSAPYSFDDEILGPTEVGFKFANFAFEEQGILLGYGLAVGLPTAGGTAEEEEEGGDAPASASSMQPPPPRFSGAGGSVHAAMGQDATELEPFFNLGFKRGSWELVGFGTFGFSTEEAGEGTTISYNLSTLYHAHDRLDLLLELDGAGGVNGEAVGRDVANVSPGIRILLLEDRPLVLGVAGSIPVTNQEGFDSRILASVFYHFGM